MGLSLKSIKRAAINPYKHAKSDDSFLNDLSPKPPEDLAGQRQEEEERRKSDLRRRIDLFYGIGDDPEAKTAAASMQGENTKLADATRQYYADQLGDNYQTAERKTRFKLARQGLLGGSEEVNQQGDVKQDRDLGATRVDEAVRRAIAGLTSQRESERLNAISLVNSGSGESAVSAAQAGLRNSFQTASSQSKADLFGDLFTGTADGMTANNVANQEAMLAARYRDRLGSFFNTGGSSTSGRVTPSA
jgi:hypothetical protein